MATTKKVNTALPMAVICRVMISEGTLGSPFIKENFGVGGQWLCYNSVHEGNSSPLRPKAKIQGDQGGLRKIGESSTRRLPM